MIFTIQNKQVKKLLEHKKKLFDEIHIVNKRMIADDKNKKKLLYKAQRIKEKIMPLMERYYKDGTIKINPPIEIPTRISLNKDVIEVEVADQVEAYREMLIKNYEEAKKSKK